MERGECSWGQHLVHGTQPGIGRGTKRGTPLCPLGLKPCLQPAPQAGMRVMGNEQNTNLGVNHTV